MVLVRTLGRHGIAQCRGKTGACPSNDVTYYPWQWHLGRLVDGVILASYLECSYVQYSYSIEVVRPSGIALRAIAFLSDAMDNSAEHAAFQLDFLHLYTVSDHIAPGRSAAASTILSSFLRISPWHSHSGIRITARCDLANSSGRARPPPEVPPCSSPLPPAGQDR